MMNRSPSDQIVHFLSDLYSVELQALAQLKPAADSAGDAGFAADLRTHHAETEQQASLVHRRLDELGGSPSAIKDGVMKLGGKAFLLFARLQTETPGRLLTHAYSYEAMEWAGYGALIELAEHLDDPTTAEMARVIQKQERTMMSRLEGHFDAVEEAAHNTVPIRDLPKHVRKHLAEVHAFETQSRTLLEKGTKIAGDAELQAVYRQHLEETQEQTAAVEQRLQALEASPSVLQDAALKLGALNWGAFFQMQQDTPMKLAAFAYAVEHLEIGAYELLARVARRAQDAETENLCQLILAQERAAAGRIANHIDVSVQATLNAMANR